MKTGRRDRNHRTIRHLKRYSEVLGVLIKFGFRDLLSPHHIRAVSGKNKKGAAAESRRHIRGYSHWERVRMALEELGPTYIKAGQILSNRPDLLPEELIAELRKLQRKVAPFPSHESRRIIEEEFGAPVEELLHSFEDEPLASASIAQVHRAVLNSGEDVVLKVQRPGIEETINTDIEILIRIAGIFQRLILKSSVLDTVGIIREIGRSLNREIDFINEANNIEKFAVNFKGTSNLVVPLVYRDLTSRKIVTMEYIDGTHVADLEILQEKNIDLKRIAFEGTQLVLEQIFEHGFFHADPHPGNLMVLDDGRICFLDFGMMGYILPKHRDYLSKIMMGIVQQDYEEITKTLMQFSMTDKIEEFDRLEYEVFVLVESYAHISLKDLNMGELLPRLISVLLNYDLRLPNEIFMLSKALITIEGVGRLINPDYDLVSHIEPFSKKLFKQRLKPDRIKQEMVSSAMDLHDLLVNLPEDTKRILAVMKSGRLKLDFDKEGLVTLFQKFGHISNRLTLSVIFASFVLGSALIFLANVPPLWRDYPLLGLGGLAGAGFTGIWLLIAIIRNNRT